MPKTRPHAVATLAPASDVGAVADSTERRRHRRIPLERAGKLHHAATGSFLPIETLNVSPGGALVRMECDSPTSHDAPHVGDRIALGVAWDGEPILDDDAMRSAVVVRLDNGGARARPTLALRFTRESALPPHVAGAA